MAHNHGNRAPGRPRTERRKYRNAQLQKEKKEKKVHNWNKQREKWKSDKKYQKEQQKRLETLLNRGGYKTNIINGTRLKELNKTKKQERKQRLLEQKRQVKHV